MSKNYKYTRSCPTCNNTIYHKRKKDCNYDGKRKLPCTNCRQQLRIASGKGLPKEEFICFTCKSKFMEWRSQITNLKTPFCSKQCWLDGEVKSLVNKRFGKLFVLSRKRDKEKQVTYYECMCDCGNRITTSHSNLITDNCKSCGCLQKEQLIKRCTKPLKHVIITQVSGYYKRNAKLRKINWSLSYSDVAEFIFQPCFYCGIVGGNLTRVKDSTRTLANNGIDRKDNTLPYTKDNCVTCCKRCNQAKNDMSFSDFTEWINRLITNFPFKK